MWYDYGGPHDAQRPGAQVTSSDGCCRKTRVMTVIAMFSSKVWEEAGVLVSLPYLRPELASFLGEDGEVA